MSDNTVAKYVEGANADYFVFPALEKYAELGAAFAVKGSKNYHYEPTGDVDYGKLAQELGINAENIIIPFQEHTATVAEVDDAVRDFRDTDGLITAKRDVVLATKVADCISLLLYDPVHHAIGNIHSGWRGTLQKIAKNGVRKMVEEYDTRPADLICVICPSIRKCHFEVDEDVKNEFAQAFAPIADEIVEQKGDKYLVDTVRCNTWMLERVGVRAQNIIDSGVCTVCQNDIVHSYRGNKEAEKHYRNLALIWLKDIME